MFESSNGESPAEEHFSTFTADSPSYWSRIMTYYLSFQIIGSGKQMLVMLILSTVLFCLYIKKLRRLIISDINSKYILITGCDSGFGHQLALKLDEMGCHVFASCLTQKGVQELKALTSEKCLPLLMDVTNQESINKCAVEVEQTLSLNSVIGLHAVINNAGIVGPLGKIEWCHIDDCKQTFEVNLFGALRINMAFSSMVKKAHGRIINIISIFGRYSGNGIPYNMSKFALEAYSDGLRRDMKNFGVSVHIIEPGFFKTGMVNNENLKKIVTNTWAKAPPEIKADYGEQVLDKILHFIEKKQFSEKLDKVSKAVTHALFAQYPKDRYVVGHDAIYFFRTLSLLPDWLADYVIAKLTG